MAQFIVPSGAQIKVRWFFQQFPAVNVFGAVGASVANVNQGMANAMDTAIKGTYTTSGLKGLMATNTQLVSVGVRYVGEPGYVEYIGTGAAVIGTGVGECLPRNVAGVVTLKTGRAGKSYQGRVFLGGLVESVNEADATFTQAAEDALLAFVNGVHDAIEAAGLTPAVLSPALPQRPTAGGGTLPPKAAFGTPIEAVRVRSQVWGSMRTRSHRG